jgi:hypothetical protein
MSFVLWRSVLAAQHMNHMSKITVVSIVTTVHITTKFKGLPMVTIDIIVYHDYHDSKVVLPCSPLHTFGHPPRYYYQVQKFKTTNLKYRLMVYLTVSSDSRIETCGRKDGQSNPMRCFLERCTNYA